MARKHTLQYFIQQLLLKNRDGSHATRADRELILMKFVNDLYQLKFGLKHLQGLKSKHIISVVNYWQQQGLSNATLKNRLSALRYLADKLNKSNIVPSNTELNIGARSYVPKQNKAIFNSDFNVIKNPYIFISLHLERVFGLRREEALKIKPYQADEGDFLRLKPSWCKGGRGRLIPIRNDEQRYWLNQAKTIAGGLDNSLIPLDKNYIQHRYVYVKQTVRAGLYKLHGLRHAYAQLRYKELTGWDAPINGGPCSQQLTKEQKLLDKQARMIISEELGHSREQITVNYCGR